jgi:hypothetical protein
MYPELNFTPMNPGLNLETSAPRTVYRLLGLVLNLETHVFGTEHQLPCIQT